MYRAKKVIHKDNKSYTVITKNDLLKFNQEYITVHRLAKDLDVLTQYLTAKLRSIGIEAIHGPLINDVKIDVFKRTDIQHLTHEKIVEIKNYDTKFGYKAYISNLDTNELSKVSLTLKIHINDVKKLIKYKVLKSYKRSSLQSLYIDEESINYVNNILNSDKFINFKNISSFIDCPPNWLKKYWIDTKYLKIIDLKIYKYVSHSELNNINNLRKNYFTGAEASKYLGMPHQHITNLNSQELIKSYYFEQKKNRLF